MGFIDPWMLEDRRVQWGEEGRPGTRITEGWMTEESMGAWIVVVDDVDGRQASADWDDGISPHRPPYTNTGVIPHVGHSKWHVGYGKTEGQALQAALALREKERSGPEK